MQQKILNVFYTCIFILLGSLIYQKIENWKQLEADKKELFSQNALFLLKAPDSLSTKIVDFSLENKLLIKDFKSKVIDDGYGEKWYAFKVDFDKKNVSVYDKTINVPIEYWIAYPIDRDVVSCTLLPLFKINYKDSDSYIWDMDSRVASSLDSLETELNRYYKMDLYRQSFSYMDTIVRFENEVDSQFLENVILKLSSFYLKKVGTIIKLETGKNISDLSKSELMSYKIKFPYAISIEFGEFNTLPPPPPVELN
jgi:hypothetical protein